MQTGVLKAAFKLVEENQPSLETQAIPGERSRLTKVLIKATITHLLLALLIYERFSVRLATQIENFAERKQFLLLRFYASSDNDCVCGTGCEILNESRPLRRKNIKRIILIVILEQRALAESISDSSLLC